ncbi:type VII secretion-associated serine protease mycosin [Micromonospora sp. Llam0]|uniref:type VII secretion-associated serine protease mycosin n=1 Tax=Micromonospora sp. Llam0 TaxID=2485143 RepID=UPI000F4AAFF3|nr:type VII secretion-associated serine protease mycosin [Micromonospora sp. Llam0]ROO62837.1 type VII secretion-associated serine protease mycosin [Micromonospora sp. Llam0]
MTSLPRHPRSAARWLAGAVLVLVTAVSGPAAPPGPGLEPGRIGTGSAAAATAALPVRYDPIRDEQWQLRELSATTAWQYATGTGVTVAVIDSGVDASHIDLAGQVLPGIDFVEDGDGWSDPVGHGTTVAALIAGRDDDEDGVLGLAPDARILPVRVLDEENRYDDALVVAKAVRWAVDNGARVINLSLGGSGDSPELAAALDYAFASDVVVVACTGNVSANGTSRVWYPAREPGVVAVAGMDRGGEQLWAGSITGPETVLTAPATGLVGARPDGYWQVQGTSFAAPLVAATAALIRSRFPEMSAGTVVTRLIETARDLGTPGRDDRYGFGLVDPVAALTDGVDAVPRNPLDDNRTPGVVGFGPAPGLESAAPTLAGGSTRMGGQDTGDQGAGWAIGPISGQRSESGQGLLSSGLLLLVTAVIGSWLARRMRMTTAAARSDVRRTPRWRSGGYSVLPEPPPTTPPRR